MGMTRAKLEFAIILTKHGETHATGETLRAIEALFRYSATYKRIQEEHCNGTCVCCNANRKEFACAKEERIEAKITELLRPFGCGPVFQGDPRGATVKVRIFSRLDLHNDMGGEGICVPTA